ncbi:MAG: BatA domain-containing protein [Planctomycetes bacterium]|nr:BatA domain-containing protein [Planctomycetota bacterium]MBL7039207.1 BatA domain-containing protein [Pirellulaceae bacterium]
MSLLTPLYMLGLFALSLPVLLHLIRRRPRGRYAFSSLMFLTPSPPRLTRKSRLDQILLLLLRAAALALLAFAFARPFLREANRLGLGNAVHRKVAMLVDVSASMRRPALWDQASSHANRWLDDLGPHDDVALFAFDSDVRAVMPFGTGSAGDPKQRLQMVRTELEKLSPTHGATRLGDALVRVADELHDASGRPEGAVETMRQIVLISDLQQGSDLEPLPSYEWPVGVQLAIERVVPAEMANAGLHVAPERTDDEEIDTGEAVRVRVTNDRESDVDQFRLRWLDEFGHPVDDQPVNSHVPPGESRIVRLPRPVVSPLMTGIILSGDGNDFDNTLFLTPMRQQTFHVMYVGNDASDDPDGLRYYLERALPNTPRSKATLSANSPNESLRPEELDATRLIVVGDALAETHAASLRDYMQDGGNVFLVLKDAQCGETLRKILGSETLDVQEDSASDYTMLGTIAWGHPLFATFADPRFNDFTKIHFWKHRRVAIETGQNLQVLARFDNGDPALIEQRHGRGRLLVLTSGWHPADSQLARSTKFVPLVMRILENSGSDDLVRSQYQVGESVGLPKDETQSAPFVVTVPGGEEIQLALVSQVFDGTDTPGIYRLERDDSRSEFAVNLASAESITAPFDAAELEQWGVRLGHENKRADIVERRRQMRDVELEKKQKLWRWLIVAALGILVLETWLAGRDRPLTSTDTSEQP